MGSARNILKKISRNRRNFQKRSLGIPIVHYAHSFTPKIQEPLCIPPTHLIFTFINIFYH